MKLNQILAATVKSIIKEALSLIADYDRKINDNDEWIEDYEAEVEISFWLKETDPAFDEDRDNILAVLTEDIKYNGFKTHLAAGKNHNEFKHWDGHSMNGEYHCWLYHCLYDHTKMGWKDILRIGKIWVEFDCRLQQSIYLE